MEYVEAREKKLDDIRRRMFDRKLTIISRTTHISLGTLYAIRDKQERQIGDEIIQKLDKYFSENE